MPVLLLQPEDNFPTPDSSTHWDAVIDLGRAPRSFYEQIIARSGYPVYSLHDLAIEVEDLQSWRPLLQHGMKMVVDRLGIDWWDVLSILIQAEMQDIRLALRLAEKLHGCSEIVTSRRSPVVDALQAQLGCSILLPKPLKAGRMHGILRRSRAAADLGFVQARQVIYDTYDPHYRWRGKLSRARGPASTEIPSVLLPTAYSNVTKTALSYASMLPEQKFLLVVARESAEPSALPPNVESMRLAAFASQKYDQRELLELQRSWNQMEGSLQEFPEFKLSIKTGVLQKGAAWLSRGLTIRDAWHNVFESHAIIGCLSGDDSNPYTRIPLLLAEQRGIPAVACHHGALDGRMAFKNFPFSAYLAKGEMESDYLKRICGVDPSRIEIGAPETSALESQIRWNPDGPWIVWFTEPYECDFWRVEAIYRELLPPLISIARSTGKSLVLKLHPFESARRRRRLVNRVLPFEDRKLIKIIDTPLSSEILQNTWCAITVESTVAFECAASGIPSFLCGWLRHAFSGYVAQYVRFGVGRLLESADDLLRIPELVGAHRDQTVANPLIQEISAQALSKTLLRVESKSLNLKQASQNEC